MRLNESIYLEFFSETKMYNCFSIILLVINKVKKELSFFIAILKGVMKLDLSGTANDNVGFAIVTRRLI